MQIMIIVFALAQFIVGSIGIATSVGDVPNSMKTIVFSLFIIFNGWIYLIVVKILDRLDENQPPVQSSHSATK